MNQTEHVGNKEESTVIAASTQDVSSSTSVAPIHIIKSFSASQAYQSLSADSFDEAVCRTWILKTLHPDGAFCPHCHSELTGESTIRNFWSMTYTTCRDCKKRFLATKGTVLYNTSLSMRQAFALAVLVALGIGNRQIAEIVSIHPDSVRLWRLRLNG